MKLESELLNQWFIRSADHDDSKINIHDYSDYPFEIALIDDVVRRIAASRGMLYKAHNINSSNKKITITKLGEALKRCSKIYTPRIMEHYNKHKLSPYFMLFAKYQDAIQLALDKLFFDKDDKQINSIIQALREDARNTGFKKVLANVERSARRNSQKLKEYINSLFYAYSKLVIVRLDLGYGMNFLNLHKRDPKPTNVKKHLSKFLRLIDRRYPAKVGYAWKIEYGHRKSYHIHLILFFDGHKVRQDVVIGNLIGEIWNQEITQGHGTYWNCNATKDKYAALGKLGIGTISYMDNELRKNLLNAASYLVKSDYYVRLNEPGLGRIFGKGNPPKKKENRPGRRRQHHNTPNKMRLN